MKRIMAAAAALTLGFTAFSCGQQDNSNERGAKTIGISMPSQQLERWNSDGASLKSQFEAAGYKVDLRYANDDKDQQNEDIKGMLDDGADLLLIAAVDGTTLSDTLAGAKEKEIPVVAYDRLIMNTNALTYYISFDNYTVGKLQGEFVKDQLHLTSTTSEYNIEFVAGDKADNNARYFFNGAYDVLKPYLSNGTMKNPSGKTKFEDVATEGWTTDKAEENMKETLSKYYSDGKNLDVVLCANDSTALGVTNALASDYKGDKYPIITGQDCDIENLKNIVDGKQSMTVYKNVSDEAAVAFKVCKTILDGEVATSKLVNEVGDIKLVFDSESYNNGVKYVQSYLLVPYVITKNNLDVLVDAGAYKWDENKTYLELAKSK